MEFTSGKSVLDTRASLLLRLKHKPGDPNAWSQFVVIYGPRLIQLGISLLRGYSVPPYNYVRHLVVTPEILREQEEG